MYYRLAPAMDTGLRIRKNERRLEHHIHQHVDSHPCFDVNGAAEQCYAVLSAVRRLDTSGTICHTSVMSHHTSVNRTRETMQLCGADIFHPIIFTSMSAWLFTSPVSNLHATGGSTLLVCSRQ